MVGSFYLRMFRVPISRPAGLRSGLYSVPAGFTIHCCIDNNGVSCFPLEVPHTAIVTRQAIRYPHMAFTLLVLLIAMAAFLTPATADASTAVSSVSLGARATSKQIIDRYGEGDYLRGRTAIVTGGNSGIGLETCKALASAGARVILCSRSVERAERALKREVYRRGKGGYRVPPERSDIEVKHLNLADLSSVERFAKDVLESEDRIDYLILNAGIMKYPELKYTKDGFEYTNACNHYGHFYLTSLLLPKMRRQKHPSRVISVSSSAHKFLSNHNGTNIFEDFNFKSTPYSGIRAYAQTKLANVRF